MEAIARVLGESVAVESNAAAGHSNASCRIDLTGRATGHQVPSRPLELGSHRIHVPDHRMGRRVVMSFHPRWDPEIEAEGPVRMTWLVEAGEADGLTKLTGTSALLPGSRTGGEFSGGVVYFVSGLKTALETGASMAAA